MIHRHELSRTEEPVPPKEEEKKKEVVKKEKDKRKGSLLKMALSVSQSDLFRSASTSTPSAASAGPAAAGNTTGKGEKESLLSGRLLKKGFFHFRHKKAQSSLSLNTGTNVNVSDCKELLELKAASSSDKHSNTSSSSSTITPGPAGPSRASASSSSQMASAASPAPSSKCKRKSSASLPQSIPAIREHELAMPASGSQTPRASICSASSVSVSSSPRWSTRELYLETLARLLPSINLHSHVRSSGSDPHRAHEREKERERKKSGSAATATSGTGASGKGSHHSSTIIGIGMSMNKAPPSSCQSLANIEPNAIATASSSTSSASSHCTSNAVLARADSQQHCPDLPLPTQHSDGPPEERTHLPHHYSPAEDRNSLAMQRRHNSVVDRSEYHHYKSILEDGSSEGDGCTGEGGGFSYSLAEDPSDASVPEVDPEPEPESDTMRESFIPRKPHRALCEAAATASTSSSSSSQAHAASGNTPPTSGRCYAHGSYGRPAGSGEVAAHSASGQGAGPSPGNPLTPQTSAGDSGIDDAINSSSTSLRLARQMERGMPLQY